MTIAKTCHWFLLLTSALIFGGGCAGLPNVTQQIAGTPNAQQLRQIVSSKGLLSPQQSQKIMVHLQQSVEPTDILGRHSVVVESVTESPLTKGNKVTLLADGEATYAAMFNALEKAQDHINIESYIVEDDEVGRKFADLLLRKQAEGVQVNLSYDSVGSMYTPAVFFQRLRDGGIRVVEFNPINPLQARGEWRLTHRNHRKMLLADGKVAITGGINISKVYSSSPFKRKTNEPAPIHWRDTDVQIEGPAVAELQRLFLATWQKQQGLPLPARDYFPDLEESGDALVRVVGSTPGETNRIPFVMYVSAIVFAERSIHLTSSYFIPDDQILKALADAAARGVDVKIILPGSSDSPWPLYAQRHHYAALLHSGVQLYEHETSLLHAKTAVIDQVWSTVGSTNLDFLSLLNNDEVNAVILSREFATEMEAMFAGDLANSRQIQRDEWDSRPWLPRIRAWFVNLFIRWL
ncbi:MAG: phospholipase D-like domain-containing protein [Desulfuromonadales bacterium]|nr:phospholipase D-like domain-containing protein [Desulfuromonadales bacterium]